MLEKLSLVVRGRDLGKDGHGEQEWAEPCSFLVEGRPEGAIGRAISGRPELGRDIVKALQVMTNQGRWTHDTSRTCIYNVVNLFACFDHLEAATPFRFEGGAENVFGQPWLFFTDWLRGRYAEATCWFVYWQCQRVIEEAVRVKFGEAPPGFVMPPNPFSQRGEKSNWDRSDDIEDGEYRQIGKALIGQLEKAALRLEEGRVLLPAGYSRDPGVNLPLRPYNDTACETSPAPDLLTRDVFSSLWNELNQHGRLPKAVLVHETEFKAFDCYSPLVKSEDLGITSAATRKGLKIQIMILAAVQKAEIPLNKYGAEQVGLDLHQLKTQGLALAKHGSLEHVYQSRRNQFLRANARTVDDFRRSRLNLELFDASNIGMQDQLRILRKALPTQEELRCAFALVLLRTGMNTDTVLSIKADDWHRPHPVQGIAGTYVELFSRKARPLGRMQYAQSSTNKPHSAYDVVRRVLNWTAPLRALLESQIKTLKLAMHGGTAAFRMEVLGKLRELQYLQNRTWLLLLDDGRVGEIEGRWTSLNQTFRELGVTRTDGSPVVFTQAMTRRAWAIFNYERSGANLLLTKLALGHSDFDSVLTYIARQRELGKQRRQWVSLQKALLQCFQSGGDVTPEVVRIMTSEGGLSESEAKRALAAENLTSKGMVCVNPSAPDKHVDPQHRPGRPCGTQNCLDGCSKAFLTFDTAVYLAREIAQLQELQKRMSVIVWSGSEYAGRLETAETVFNAFSASNRKMAEREVQRGPVRPIFGQPSQKARLLADEDANG